jgi:hypothetical protein
MSSSSEIHYILIRHAVTLHFYNGSRVIGPGNKQKVVIIYSLCYVNIDDADPKVTEMYLWVCISK